MGKYLFIFIALIFANSTWADQLNFDKLSKINEVHNKNGISFEIYFNDPSYTRKKIRIDMRTTDYLVAKEMREIFTLAGDHKGYLHFIPDKNYEMNERVQYLELCSQKTCIGSYSN